MITTNGRHIAKFKDIEPDGFIAPVRAAKLLDVSPKTIYARIKEGRIPAYKIDGKNIRIKAKDFLNYLDAATEKYAL